MEYSNSDPYGIRGFVSIARGIPETTIGASAEFSAGTHGASGSAGGGIVTGFDITSGLGLEFQIMAGDPAALCATLQ